MTDNDNVFFGIELLDTRRNLAHRDKLRSFEACPFDFPRFADVEKGESLSTFLEGVYLTNANFEVHLRVRPNSVKSLKYNNVEN